MANILKTVFNKLGNKIKTKGRLKPTSNRKSVPAGMLSSATKVHAISLAINEDFFNEIKTKYNSIELKDICIKHEGVDYEFSCEDFLDLLNIKKKVADGKRKK